MIFVLNNIKFGHPKLYKYQFEFFDEYLIGKKADKIIIIGDLFYNTKHTTFPIISKVRDIIKNLNCSKIELIGNEYCHELFEEFLNSTLDYNPYDLISKVKDASLFQLSKENKCKIGFYTFEDEKKFVENTYTPRFLEYKIKSIEELESLEITKDFIDVEIDSELLNKAEYKNKIDIYLSNHTFNNVFYTEKKKEEEKVVLDSKNINIRNILVNNVEEELKDELKEIFTIYDENQSKL